MLKISHAAFLCLSQLISVQFALEFLKCVAQTEIAKKVYKNPIFAFKVIQDHYIIDFGANRKPVYDFLLVINSKPYLYIGPISHRF